MEKTAEAGLRSTSCSVMAKGFETIEQYQNIGGALKGCKRDTKPVVLVECMSNLLANECFEENGHPDNIFAECMAVVFRVQSPCNCD